MPGAIPTWITVNVEARTTITRSFTEALAGKVEDCLKAGVP
jgi:hypothetical protein